MAISNQILTVEDSFKQIDLLYDIYKLGRQKDLMSNKLDKVVKLIKNNSNENVLAKLKALRIFIDEINKKEEFVTSKLHKAFNFYQISQKLKELNHYIFNINKALKIKEIDVNTYRLTKKYYQNDLKVYTENLHKLRVIAREYVVTLNNKLLQIKVEERFQKSNKLNIPTKKIHKKTELTRFIKFLNDVILKNNPYTIMSSK